MYYVMFRVTQDVTSLLMIYENTAGTHLLQEEGAYNRDLSGSIAKTVRPFGKYKEMY
jgi:hypothetical protein